MATFSSASKSNRLLQSKRYTLADFDSQEAYTRVLDLNSSEIYTKQDSLPGTSATLPYSGSTQDNSLITSGSGADEVNIARYYYRIELSPTSVVTGGKYLTWFAVSGSSGTEVGYDFPVSPQVIQNTQMVNWISNKYIQAADAANLAETPGVDPGSPGYNVYLRKGNSAAEEDNKIADNDVVFDYKTGILQWMNATNAPSAATATNNRIYLSGYQYEGQTLDQFVASGSGGGSGVGFPFSGSAVITGSLLVSQSSAGEGVDFTNAPLTASNITASGGLDVLNITASGATFGSASIDYLTVNTVISGSTIITSGSNTLGDAMNDVQTLIGTTKITGSANVTGSFQVSGSTLLSGSTDIAGVLSLQGITDVSASIAAAGENAGIFVETGSFFATSNSLQITGSTLQNSPLTTTGQNITSSNDGTGGVAKYDVVTSHSMWNYNHNVGVPKSNAWQHNLDGSYFENYDQNTDVSEILRFVAGLLSASAPNALPNTRTYGALSQSAVTDNTAGSKPSGNVPQGSTNPVITYFNSKGFVQEGDQLFWNVSASLKSEYNRTKTYGSNPAGSTDITSSLTPSGELFGLGTIGLPVTITSSATFVYSDNSDSTATTFTSASHASVIQTGTGGSIIKIGNIQTAAPAVIPNAFQDGFFEGAFQLKQNFDSNIEALALSSTGSAGFYSVNQSVSLQTGSGGPFTSAKALNEQVFVISGSVDSATNFPQTLAITQRQSGSLTATSSSLSGAPYLLTGTYHIGTEVGGLFNPMYVDNTNIIALSENPSDSKIALSNAPNHAISANINSSGQINTSNTIFPLAGGAARATSTVPFETDLGIVSASVDFDAGTGGGTSKTNITRTGISTGNGDSQFTVRSAYKNRADSATNLDSIIPYHKAGEFEQNIDSGSLAYYGALQGEINNQRLTFGTTTRSENFIGEKYRLQLTNNALKGNYDQGDKFDTASYGVNTLGGKDLQVKPGFLIQPGDSSFGYWLEDPDTTSAGHYKYYIRTFQKDSSEVSGQASTFAINLVKSSDSTNVTLADWGTGTTAGDISCIVLYQFSAVGGNNGLSNARFFDMSNINGNVGGEATYTAGTAATNPFGSTITVAGMAGGASIVSGKTTHTLNDAQGSKITNANPNVVVIVRYAGDGGSTSIDPIKRIDVQLS